MYDAYEEKTEWEPSRHCSVPTFYPLWNNLKGFFSFTSRQFPGVVLIYKASLSCRHWTYCFSSASDLKLLNSGFFFRWPWFFVHQSPFQFCYNLNLLDLWYLQIIHNQLVQGWKQWLAQGVTGLPRRRPRWSWEAAKDISTFSNSLRREERKNWRRGGH